VLGIAGDLVLAAVSVAELYDKHVNSEQVTDGENANSKQQERETGERVEYQEPFHRSSRLADGNVRPDLRRQYHRLCALFKLLDDESRVSACCESVCDSFAQDNFLGCR
jgi:hypothetical protein